MIFLLDWTFFVVELDRLHQCDKRAARMWTTATAAVWHAKLNRGDSHIKTHSATKHLNDDIAVVLVKYFKLSGWRHIFFS